MGTWALHSFANDDAGDFISDLIEGADLSPAKEAIERVQNTAGYLEAPEAQQAIAACEALALVSGHASAASQAEEELTAWVARVKPAVDPALISQAVHVVDRVLAPDSELRELWEESEEFNAWQADVTALRARLQGGSPPISRTLTKRPIEALRSVHVKAKEVQCRVQARCG